MQKRCLHPFQMLQRILQLLLEHHATMLKDLNLPQTRFAGSHQVAIIQLQRGKPFTYLRLVVFNLN